MNQTTPQKPQVTPSHLDEEIIVVKRTTLFNKENAWHGVKTDNIEEIVKNIKDNQEYMPRAIAETDPAFKQIIPYMIFKCEDKFFVMQRKKTASEQRLANKFSIGIGGHMRKEDMEGKSIFDWAKREFEEEVTYTGDIKISTVGILNDDSNDVGKVHLGLVLLLEGSNDQIFIKDEHKSGVMLTALECEAMMDEMESWSKLSLQAVL